MPFIGGGIETSLAQLAQVQRVAAEGKDRERAAGESARRAADSVQLRVAGVENAAAARKPNNDDLEDDQERRKKSRKNASDSTDDHGVDEQPKPSIDLRA